MLVRDEDKIFKNLKVMKKKKQTLNFSHLKNTFFLKKVCKYIWYLVSVLYGSEVSLLI